MAIVLTVTVVGVEGEVTLTWMSPNRIRYGNRWNFLLPYSVESAQSNGTIRPSKKVTPESGTERNRRKLKHLSRKKHLHIRVSEHLNISKKLDLCLNRTLLDSLLARTSSHPAVYQCRQNVQCTFSFSLSAHPGFFLPSHILMLYRCQAACHHHIQIIHLLTAVYLKH